MHKLVLIRHGESVWNKKNLFNGWVDTKLSFRGKREAKKAAKLLKDFRFDIAFTSELKRAIDTLKIVAKGVPFKKSWKLNERHYGDLQGKNKKKIREKYGKETFFKWRRSYEVKPPPIQKNNPYYKETEPRTESLKDTYERVVPYFQKEIAPEIQKGKKVLISAHGSTFRALSKYLGNISDKDIAFLNIPTGIPLVYEFDDNLKVLRHYYLGDKKEVGKAIKEVRDQGSEDALLKV